MKKIFFSFLIFLRVATLVEAQKLPAIDSTLNASLASYVSTHYHSPEEYILSKFDDHDVVFLGEFHKFKENLELLHRLIPLLYQKHVYTLAYEFARREDQFLIDSLLLSPTYDEKLARLLMFQKNVHDPWQEYVEVYKVAWKLNHSLPKGKRPFRILGVNNSPDWSLIKKPEDRGNNQIMIKVWKGSTEEDWGKVILDSVVNKHEKALVYSGTHHAFTEYRQPIVFQGEFKGWGEVRMGNVVFKVIGKRAITIALHAPWYNSNGWDEPWVFPADGYLDSFFTKQGTKFLPIGFDTKGTPFGKLPGTNSIYKFGYQNFTLDKFCDGYVYLCPFSEYHPITLIANFVNQANIDLARSQSDDPNFRSASVIDFNKDAIEYIDSQFMKLPRYK